MAGRSAVELTLYVLLPVMVVMMAVMRLLEAKGVLDFVSKLLTPVLKPFGVPGLGVFAMLQLLLVSFLAPVATFVQMEKQNVSRREIAATLAMILTMSQANAVFPMLTVGLNLPVTLLSSLVGGLAAAAVTYYVFARSKKDEMTVSVAVAKRPQRRAKVLDLLIAGGLRGMGLSLKAVPSLVLALVLVEGLKAMGAISLLEAGLSPLLKIVGLPAIAVLPFATKYLAGGTAMMGVAMNLVNEGSLSALDLNRIAGFMINPLDLVGVSVLVAAGSQVKDVKWPAIFGAIIGILVRGFLHLLIF